jgi:hypothetical protein
MVYRPVVSRLAVAGYVVFALWWAVDDVVTGDGGRLVVAAPVMLALGAALWGVFWRPAVVVDDDGVELKNVVRDVHVPWALLDDVDTQYALTLHVGERRHRSWAAGAPGRPAPLSHPGTAREHQAVSDGMPLRSSRSLRADSGAAAFMVEQRRDLRRGLTATGEERVTTRWVWHWPTVTLAGALAAWVVALTR